MTSSTSTYHQSMCTLVKGLSWIRLETILFVASLIANEIIDLFKNPQENSSSSTALCYSANLFLSNCLSLISSLKTKELTTVCPHLVRTISAFVGSISELIIQKTEFHGWYESCMNFILIALEATVQSQRGGLQQDFGKSSEHPLEDHSISQALRAYCMNGSLLLHTFSPSHSTAQDTTIISRVTTVIAGLITSCQRRLEQLVVEAVEELARALARLDTMYVSKDLTLFYGSLLAAFDNEFRREAGPQPHVVVSLVLCIRYALRYSKFGHAVDSSLGSSNTSFGQGNTSADNIAHTDICTQFILEVWSRLAITHQWIQQTSTPSTSIISDNVNRLATSSSSYSSSMLAACDEICYLEEWLVYSSFPNILPSAIEVIAQNMVAVYAILDCAVALKCAVAVTDVLGGKGNEETSNSIPFMTELLNRITQVREEIVFTANYYIWLCNIAS